MTPLGEAGSAEVLERTVRVRFDASKERGMPWDFRPVEREMEIRIGVVTHTLVAKKLQSDQTTKAEASQPKNGHVAQETYLEDDFDECPEEPEDFDGVADEDGCPDWTSDRDGDGRLDDVDECPDEPEDLDGYRDGDGCPDSDNDKRNQPLTHIHTSLPPLPSAAAAPLSRVGDAHSRDEDGGGGAHERGQGGDSSGGQGAHGGPPRLETRTRKGKH